jgi:hypothetical protein
MMKKKEAFSSQTSIKGKNKDMLEMLIGYFPFCRKIMYLSFKCIVVQEVGRIK